MSKKTVSTKNAATGSMSAAELETYRVPNAPVASSSNAAATGQVDARGVALVGRILEKAQRLQEPAVAKYVGRLRAAHPDDSPEQIIERLERRFLNTVTASGAAVGATASIPGVGTVTAIGALTADTALFIEASALLALAVAEVHGISPDDAERRRSLVLSVALGEEGVTALGKVLGTRGTGAVSRLALPGLPPGTLTKLNKALTGKLVKKFAIRRAPILVGKLIPGGIGAAVGGAGNRALGTMVTRNAREAFGPPPRFWDIDGTVLSGAVSDGNRESWTAGAEPPRTLPGKARRLIRGRS